MFLAVAFNTRLGTCSELTSEKEIIFYQIAFRRFFFFIASPVPPSQFFWAYFERCYCYVRWDEIKFFLNVRSIRCSLVAAWCCFLFPPLSHWQVQQRIDANTVLDKKLHEAAVKLYRQVRWGRVEDLT